NWQCNFAETQARKDTLGDSALPTEFRELQPWQAALGVREAFPKAKLIADRTTPGSALSDKRSPAAMTQAQIQPYCGKRQPARQFRAIWLDHLRLCTATRY